MFPYPKVSPYSACMKIIASAAENIVIFDSWRIGVDQPRQLRFPENCSEQSGTNFLSNSFKLVFKVAR